MEPVTNEIKKEPAVDTESDEDEIPVLYDQLKLAVEVRIYIWIC